MLQNVHQIMFKHNFLQLRFKYRLTWFTIKCAWKVDSGHHIDHKILYGSIFIIIDNAMKIRIDYD